MSSICGIECKFSDLKDIWTFFNFSGIDFSSYYFYTVDQGVYSNGRRKIVLPDKFHSDFFQELIRRSFVCERLVLHLYPKECIPEEIDTYDDFLQSKCELIILVCDCDYVEVYCKNQDWLQTMLSEVANLPKASYSVKYADTDSRSCMYV